MCKKHTLLCLFIIEWSFYFTVSFHLLVKPCQVSIFSLNPTFLEVNLKCCKMGQSHGQFVLVLAEGWVCGSVMVIILGKYVLRKGVPCGPLGISSHHILLLAVEPLRSTSSPHLLVFVPSSCHRGLRELGCFIASIPWWHRTQVTCHHRVPGLFSDQEALIIHLLSLLSIWKCPLVRDTHQLPFLLSFV